MVTKDSSAKELADYTGYSEPTVFAVAKKLTFKLRGRTDEQHERLMDVLLSKGKGRSKSAPANTKNARKSTKQKPPKRLKPKTLQAAPRIPGDAFKVVVLPGSEEAAVIIPLSKLADMLKSMIGPS